MNRFQVNEDEIELSCVLNIGIGTALTWKTKGEYSRLFFLRVWWLPTLDLKPSRPYIFHGVPADPGWQNERLDT
jgi:hypothetical protein